MTVTNFATACQEARSHVSGLTTVKVVHDNGPLSITTESIFGRLTIEFNSSSLEELGRKRWRHFLTAIMDFRVKPDTGDAAALAECDKIVNGCRSISLNGITYREPRLERVGLVSGWYIIRVECPFYFDVME